MRMLEIDENLVMWVDSFVRGRKVVMSVDGEESKAKEVTTGLPQGSPVSPVLLQYIWQTFIMRWKSRWRGAGGFRLWMM